MKYLKIKHPIAALLFLWAALMRDYTGIIRIGLLVSLLHECGHILIYLFLKKSMPMLSFSVIGIGLLTDEVSLSDKQRLCLAAAGPATNFALCLSAYCCIQYKSSYWLWMFLCANAIIGAFNLLPVGKLDGAQMWKSLHLQHK